MTGLPHNGHCGIPACAVRSGAGGLFGVLEADND
jgi:hypothetical protein